MTPLIRPLLTILLWVVIVALLAIVIVPRFLDRRYYSGAVSDHFDGQRFFNPDGEDTAAVPSGGGRAGFLWRQLTGRDGRPTRPASVAVAQSHPAARVNGDRMVVTWIGHATALVQTGGLNILTDPIWAERAGPFGFGPARVTAPGVTFDRLPKIDVVLVSHNHYDHLDLATLKRLWARDRPLIVTAPGNDAILRSAGIGATALDWGGSATVGGGTGDGMRPIRVHVTRNHHWSSRWFADRNRALWSSFVVELPGGHLFFAGDTGFGDGRWADEAAAIGPVRLALIPIGAFRFVPGQMRTGSHIGPVEAVEVARRLGARTAIPIHWGTFRLSFEARNTPPALLRAAWRCSASPGRLPGATFDPVAIGQPVVVPPIAAGSPAVRPAPDPRSIARCMDTPAVRALR